MRHIIFHDVDSGKEVFVDAELFGFFNGNKPTIEDVEGYFTVEYLRELGVESTEESCRELCDYVKSNFEMFIS